MEIGAREQNTKPVCNQPYDESLEVNDSEDIASVNTPTPQPAESKAESRRPSRRRLRGTMATTNNSSSDEFDDEEKPKQVEPISGQAALRANDDEDDEDEEEDSDEEDTDEDDDEQGSALEGAYDPADYDNLPVATEIKELFQYITRYTPQDIELDHKLKPFIPDFIPAVGDIDAFLKVPRPDGKPDNLGLLVLDEPCVKQSDPTVLALWLSEETKQHSSTEMKKVTSISNPQRNTKAVDSWMDSISELHRSKPPATVHYTKPMPDIDSLMQEWPAELEDLLGKVDLPTAETDCSLKDYVDIICVLLDIPVYQNRIQSLHVLFTLYQEFNSSQHFKHSS